MKTVILIMLMGSVNTVEHVKTYIDKTDLKHKDIVLRQAVLETGWLKCTNCSMDRNNLFGWYYKKKYLSFDTWQESVDYYCRWQKRHYKGGDYYKFLKDRGYATDPRYITKLKALW